MDSDLSLERLSTTSDAYRFCEALYNASFPENERRDFHELVAQNNDTQQTFLIRFGGRAAGFVSRLNSSRYSHIIYFAIDECLRGQGIGSRVLQILSGTSPILPLIADLEQPETGVENESERRARLQFYERAGFTLSPVSYRWHDENWVMVIRGGTLNDEQFRQFWDEVVPMISAAPSDL